MLQIDLYKIMALSKSQIKKIEKHSDKYVVICPIGALTRELMYGYKMFRSKDNKYRTFIINKKDYDDITKRSEANYIIYVPIFDYNDVDDIGSKIVKYGINSTYFKKALDVSYGKITYIDRNYELF